MYQNKIDGIRYKNTMRGIAAARTYLESGRDHYFRLDGNSGFAKGFNRTMKKAGDLRLDEILRNSPQTFFHND